MALRARSPSANEVREGSRGHPSARDRARALAVSRAPVHLIKFAKEDYRCASCEAHKSGIAPLPFRGFIYAQRSGGPGPPAVLQLPNYDGAQALWMLNMVCMGTSFQLVERVRSKEPEEVWAAFARSWGRLLGWPAVLWLDQGTEFLSEFLACAADGPPGLGAAASGSGVIQEPAVQQVGVCAGAANVRAHTTDQW